MSGSADAQDGNRSSSTTFLKIITMLALVVAGAEFFVAQHYRQARLGPEIHDAALKFHKLYYDTHVWERTQWMGIRSDQTPTDNWNMQEILHELRPDYVIETGTLNGGTTLYYATLLSLVNPNGKVITVDVEPHVEAASKWPVWKERVELITGSSVDPKVTDHIAQEVAGKKVLVTLDSLHTRDHVLKEMEIYSKLVTPGSYLGVQDTNINGNPVGAGVGPGTERGGAGVYEDARQFCRGS